MQRTCDDHEKAISDLRDTIKQTKDRMDRRDEVYREMYEAQKAGRAMIATIMDEIKVKQNLFLRECRKQLKPLEGSMLAVQLANLPEEQIGNKLVRFRGALATLKKVHRTRCIVQFDGDDDDRDWDLPLEWVRPVIATTSSH